MSQKHCSRHGIYSVGVTEGHEERVTEGHKGRGTENHKGRRAGVPKGRVTEGHKERRTEGPKEGGTSGSGGDTQRLDAKNRESSKFKWSPVVVGEKSRKRDLKKIRKLKKKLKRKDKLLKDWISRDSTNSDTEVRKVI